MSVIFYDLFINFNFKKFHYYLNLIEFNLGKKYFITDFFRYFRMYDFFPINLIFFILF